MVYGVLMALSVAILLYLGFAIYKQYSKLSYYEKQGIFVYPGSWRPLVGMINEFNVYQAERESDKVVEVDDKWFFQNIDRFVDKKDNVPNWIGNYLK